MAIVVKNAANPSVALAAGAGAAQAAQRNEAARAGALAMERRDAQIRQQEHDVAMQKSSQDFHAGLQDKAQGQQDMRTILGEAFRSRAAEQGYELRQDEFEFKLSAKQEADQEKYRTALYEIENNDGFSEEEKTEAKRRISAKIAGIEPLPKRRTPSAYPEGQNIGQSWTDESTGALLTRGPDGTPKKIADDPSAVKASDVASMVKQVTESLTVESLDGTIKKPSMEEISKGVREIYELQRELRRPGGVAPEQDLTGLAIQGALNPNLPGLPFQTDVAPPADPAAAGGSQPALPSPAPAALEIGPGDADSAEAQIPGIGAAVKRFESASPEEREAAFAQVHGAVSGAIKQRLSVGGGGRKFSVSSAEKDKGESRQSPYKAGSINHGLVDDVVRRNRLSPDRARVLHEAVTDYRNATGAGQKTAAFKRLNEMMDDAKASGRR